MGEHPEDSLKKLVEAFAYPAGAKRRETGGERVPGRITTIAGIVLLAAVLVSCSEQEPETVTPQPLPKPAAEHPVDMGSDEGLAIKEALLPEVIDAPFTGPGWVALWHPELADLIDQPSPPSRQWAMPLWNLPEDESLLVGTLIVNFSAEAGLTAEFMPNGGRAVPFAPDLYDPDWGYGPWFHHTVMETRSGWVRLPKRPFPEPVWMNVDAAFGDVHPMRTIAAQPGEVYRLDGENVVITDITGDRVSLRPEQPADMPCGEDVPPIKDVAASVIDRADLFDADGHLKLTVAYMRGC